MRKFRSLIEKDKNNLLIVEVLTQIKNKLNEGIKLSDEKEIKEMLTTIGQHSSGTLQELLMGCTTGIWGNYLYVWIKEIQKLLFL